MDECSEPRVLTRSALEDLRMRLQAWHGEPWDSEFSIPPDFAFDVELFRLIHDDTLMWSEEEESFVYIFPMRCYDPKTGEWMDETRVRLPLYTQDFLTAYHFRDEMLGADHVFRIEEIPCSTQLEELARQGVWNVPGPDGKEVSIDQLPGWQPEWRVDIRDGAGDGGQGQHPKCPIAMVLAVLSHCILRGGSPSRVTII